MRNFESAPPSTTGREGCQFEKTDFYMVDPPGPDIQVAYDSNQTLVLKFHGKTPQGEGCEYQL